VPVSRHAAAVLKRALGSREFWSLLAGLAAVLLLWNTPVMQPLKWLTVLFHELSHAIAGWLTGGRVIAMNITNREAGICQVAGGNYTLILLAGYPGSLCWGLAALLLARREPWVRPSLYVAGALLAGVTLLYVRPVPGFGFIFCLATAAALLAWAHRGGPPWQALSLRFLGLSSCVYVLADIQQDVFRSHGGVSDATLLAQHTGVPALLWGLLWYGLSLALIFAALLALPARPAPRDRPAL